MWAGLTEDGRDVDVGERGGRDPPPVDGEGQHQQHIGQQGRGGALGLPTTSHMRGRQAGQALAGVGVKMMRRQAWGDL
jgi:hypothetical protein